jgi:arginyl-tRNA synthetase
VARAAASCEPHILAHELLDLAGDFSRWYTACNSDSALRVVCDDSDLRTARIELVRAFRDALTRGLSMLGLSTLEVM